MADLDGQGTLITTKTGQGSAQVRITPTAQEFIPGGPAKITSQPQATVQRFATGHVLQDGSRKPLAQITVGGLLCQEEQAVDRVAGQGGQLVNPAYHG